MRTAARDTGWFTSSYSNGGDACVECRLVPGAAVGVRDSKDRAGGALSIARRPWAAFVTAVRTGEFPGC